MHRAHHLLSIPFVAILAACTHGAPPSPATTASAVPAERVPLASASAATTSVATASASVAAASAAPSERPAAAAPPASSSAPARYPVRWTKSLSLKSLADLPTARSEAVLANGGELELTHDPDNAKRKVRSCEDYDKARADGFGPVSNYDIAIESFFLAKCTPLRFVAEATGSAKSWVSDLRLDRRPLHTLPGSMNLILAGLTDEQQRAIAAGQRLDAFQPELVVTKSSATSVTFGEPKVDTSTVDIIAYGDFDHDGIEDVLLFQSHHSLEGSFRSFHHVVATRKGPRDPLTVTTTLR